MELSETCHHCTSPKVVILRDVVGTRACEDCGKQWLPEDCPIRWVLAGKKAIAKPIRLIPKDHMDFGSPGYEFLDTNLSLFQKTNSTATKKELLENAIANERCNIVKAQEIIQQSERNIEVFEVQL